VHILQLVCIMNQTKTGWMTEKTPTLHATDITINQRLNNRIMKKVIGIHNYILALLTLVFIYGCSTDSVPESTEPEFTGQEGPINIHVEGEGEVEIEFLDEMEKTANELRRARLTANPNDGWQFARWSGDIESNENPTIVEFDSNVEIGIEFQKSPFFLADNGVTVQCPDAQVGETGYMNGKLFEAVDRELLIQRGGDRADLTKVCTSLVTDMSGMYWFIDFYHDQSIVSNWDVSNVTSMMDMFNRTPFNQPIGKWDVSNVTNMTTMFIGTPFNQPIENWDVSNVTDMVAMFSETPFNQPIGEWDVGNVTNMNEMFFRTQFNQPINTWCVSQIPSEPDAFSYDSPLTEENKPVWGTCPD